MREDALQYYQGNIFSTPTTSGNDVLPSPSTIHDNLITQPEGAQRAFEIIRVPQQTLLHMSQGTP